MTLALIVWYLVGFFYWLKFRIVDCGELYVGDIVFAMLTGVTGPIIPLVIGTWYFAVWIETTAMILIWRRKDKQ